MRLIQNKVLCYAAVDLEAKKIEKKAPFSGVV
jgi:hypothetical protein